MNIPNFTGRNVSIAEIALATGKSQQFIRVGLQNGMLKFGYAYHVTSEKTYSYYCPDKLVWEQTGYFREQTKPYEKEEFAYETA